MNLVNGVGGRELIELFPNTKSAPFVSFFWFVWLRIFSLGSDFEVDYESEENAQIVYSALAVDKEVVFRDASTQTNFCRVCSSSSSCC